MSHFARESAIRRFGLAHFLWLASALFIVYGTTIPFHWVSDRAAIAENFARATLNPFPSLTNRQDWHVPDLVQNVLLFLPFGVIGAVALRCRGVVRRIATVMLSGAGLSLGVEILQLCTVDRVSSFMDVATNAAGTLMGAVAVPVLAWVLAGSLRRISWRSLGEGTTFFAALLMVLVICAAAWEPFDPTLDVGSLWAKLKAFQEDLWQHAGLGDQGLQCLRFGMLVVALKSSVSRRLSTFSIVLFVSAFGVALEISQLFIEFRMPSAEDAAMAMVGALVGAGVGRPVSGWSAAHTRTRTRWLGVLVVLTWIGAAMQMLAPFDIVAVPHAMAWVPFLNYYAYTTMQTVSHVVEIGLVYLPVGFALAWAAPREGGAIPLAAGLAIAMQAPIEYLQRWVAGRFPDVTDIGVAVMGCVCGAWIGGPGVQKARAYLNRVDQP